VIVREDIVDLAGQLEEHCEAKAKGTLNAACIQHKHTRCVSWMSHVWGEICPSPKSMDGTALEARLRGRVGMCRFRAGIPETAS
jgi:hypothetical protein